MCVCVYFVHQHRGPPPFLNLGGLLITKGVCESFTRIGYFFKRNHSQVVDQSLSCIHTNTHANLHAHTHLRTHSTTSQ